MNQDQIERDRMLTEVHTNMDHLVQWTKTHDLADDTRFREINKKLFWGAIALLIVAAASGSLPQILTHIKIGG